MAGLQDVVALDLASVASVSHFWTTGTHTIIKVIGTGIVPPDGGEVRVRVSIDGSTFLTTGVYDRAGKRWTSATTTANVGGGATTYMGIFNGAGGAAGEQCGFELTIVNIQGSNWKGWESNAAGVISSGFSRAQIMGGDIRTTSEILGIQILNSLGTNFTAGDVWVYELADPTA